MSTCSRHPTENVRKIYKWYDNGSYASTECLTNVMRCMMENDIAALEEYVDFLRADPKAAARINERSSSGLTALSYCARAGCADMLRLLLTVPGVDVTLVDNNYRHNALMWAAGLAMRSIENRAMPTRALFTATAKDSMEHF